VVRKGKQTWPTTSSKRHKVLYRNGEEEREVAFMIFLVGFLSVRPLLPLIRFRTCGRQDFAGTNPSLTKFLLFFVIFNHTSNVPYCQGSTLSFSMKTTWKDIQPVPTSQEFLDIVLSRTQRRLPTQIRAGFQISRIRSKQMIIL
jgi:hypothetical protein